MIDRLVSFSPGAVKAVLEGRKTRRSRVFRPQSLRDCWHHTGKFGLWNFDSPDGKAINAHYRLVQEGEKLQLSEFDVPLEIVSIRVERIQDMTEEEAEKEGIGLSEEYPTYREAYKASWLEWEKTQEDEYRWEANPWVWVFGFCLGSK